MAGLQDTWDCVYFGHMAMLRMMVGLENGTACLGAIGLTNRFQIKPDVEKS